MRLCVDSDIQEVLGSAIAFQILFNFPLWVGCLVRICVALLRLFARISSSFQRSVHN